MNILFAGSSDFGADCLKFIVENEKYSVKTVITNPDKPAGRGQKISVTPIKELAVKYGVNIFQPENINSKESLEFIKNLQPDIILVVAYGKIISKQLLDTFQNKWINIHASLLPQYRGASPINFSLFNGNKQTGITIMQMNEKMDEGDILLQREIEIMDNDNFGSLYLKLQKLAVVTLEIFLNDYINNTVFEKIKQNEALASYTFKITKDICKLNFDDRAIKLHNKIRGLSPLPCAWTLLDTKKVKIYNTQVFNVPFENIENINNGALICKDNRLFVKCGCNGLLEIIELQIEGKNRIDAVSFINGYLRGYDKPIILK